MFSVCTSAASVHVQKWARSHLRVTWPQVLSQTGHTQWWSCPAQMSSEVKAKLQGTPQPAQPISISMDQWGLTSSWTEQGMSTGGLRHCCSAWVLFLDERAETVGPVQITRGGFSLLEHLFLQSVSEDKSGCSLFRQWGYIHLHAHFRPCQSGGSFPNLKHLSLSHLSPFLHLFEIWI